MNDRLCKATAAASAAAIMLTGALRPVRAEETEPVRLMCLGDSITDGFWMAGGYRNTLCELITADGLEPQIDMVGPQWGGTGYDPQHAGYSGYSIEDIPNQRMGLLNFSEWLMESYPADVVFLEIGTNDILSLYDLEHLGDRLDRLIEVILSHLPENGRLYLATLPIMNADVTTYIDISQESMDEKLDLCNTQIRALAEQKQEAGKPVELAEINLLLTMDDLVDGVHPNETGYEKMGKFWYARLTEYLAERNGETQPSVTTETTATETTTQPLETTTETVLTTTETTTETTTTESAVTTTEPPPAPRRGDIDGDGMIRIADVVLLTKHLGTAQTLTEEQAARADMDGNGVINATDLTLLKRVF